MDSLHKGGGFKTIYMRKGAIEKKLEKSSENHECFFYQKILKICYSNLCNLSTSSVLGILVYKRYEQIANRK